MPGGGLNALRGENNVQGSTDMGLLFNTVTGYMAIPSEAAHPTLKDYLDKETPKASFWINKPKFFVSMLKAFWGEAATPANQFAYDYLPKIGKGSEGSGYSWMPLFESMAHGAIKGVLIWGMNPAVASANLNQAYSALDKLEWMAAFDLWETYTSVFWKRPGANPKDIKTEVFLFPAADSMEKEGSVSNSGRWIYSGYYPGPDKKNNKAAARDKKDPTGLGRYPGWAFAWPVNRRIIYNRCSLDPQGRPWSKDKALFAWDPAAKTWKNFDVPDFKWIDPATKVHAGPEESAKAPFLMLPEGKSRLFVPGGLCKEGPFPEHYEALELDHRGFRTDLGNVPHGIYGREWMSKVPWVALGGAGSPRRGGRRPPPDYPPPFSPARKGRIRIDLTLANSL